MGDVSPRLRRYMNLFEALNATKSVQIEAYATM